MGHGDSNIRRFSEINSMRELCDARREVDIREWFARERLEDDAAAVFSLGTLISMLVPRGSLFGRMAGGVAGGLTGGLGQLFSISRTNGDAHRSAPLRKGAAVAHAATVRKDTAVAKSAPARRGATVAHAAVGAKIPMAAVKAKVQTPKAVQVVKTAQAAKSAKSAKAAVSKTRSPEIVVEVELDKQAKDRHRE